MIDETSRMAYLVAKVEDPYGLKSDKRILPFGSYVNAEVGGIELANAARVPRHLLRDGRIPVMDSDSKLRFKPVEVVRREGPMVLISDGLENGDDIVISALEYPVEGMTVKLPDDGTLDESLQEQQDEQIAMKKD